MCMISKNNEFTLNARDFLFALGEYHVYCTSICFYKGPLIYI